MNGFRAGVSLYGLLLGAASLWILLAEFSSPGIRGLPTSPGEAAVAAQHRGEALWAARAAVVRGDLWAEAAFTYANLEWLDFAQPLGEALDQARATATRAVSLMPGNSGVWLMLADLSSRYRWQTPSPTECLKMSYYTGPHEDRPDPASAYDCRAARPQRRSRYSQIFFGENSRLRSWTALHLGPQSSQPTSRRRPKPSI